jgi:hypothetical protein
MATPQTLQITDGTTTIDLLGGIVRIEQDGWAPAVAAPTASELSGRGAWEDTAEDLSIAVICGPSDNPGATLNAIRGLLEQARRWALGDPSATAVRLRARIADSRLAEGVILEVAVLGGELPGVSAQFTRLLGAGGIPPVTLTIARRGPWLNPTYEEASSSAGTGSSVRTITFGSAHPTWSPYGLTLTFAAGSSASVQRGFVLIGSTATAFSILNIDTAAGADPDLSSVAHAPALNGAYLRYLPAANTFSDTAVLTITNPARAVDVYAMLEAKGQDFAVQARLRRNISTAGGTGVFVNGETVVIEAGRRDVVYLGRFDGGGTTLNELYLRLTTAATHASNQLRIDTVVCHADEGPASSALYLPYGVGNGACGGSATYASPITVRNEPLAYPSPIVGQPDYSAPWGDLAPFLYRTSSSLGDDQILPADGYLQMKGATIAVLPFFLANPNGSPPNWRPQSGGAAVNLTATARRYKAYLSLE